MSHNADVKKSNQIKKLMTPPQATFNVESQMHLGYNLRRWLIKEGESAGQKWKERRKKC
jgi:hypothetical protein